MRNATALTMTLLAVLCLSIPITTVWGVNTSSQAVDRSRQAIDDSSNQNRRLSADTQAVLCEIQAKQWYVYHPSKPLPRSPLPLNVCGVSIPAFEAQVSQPKPDAPTTARPAP